MTGTKGIYNKALILLTVFSMNTGVSFACSFSNFFHERHHHKSGNTEHKDLNHTHSHSDKNSHQHDAGNVKHHSASSKKSKDDCCSSSVVAIEKVDKSVSRTIEAPYLVFTALVLSTYSVLSTVDSEQKTFFPDNVRWRIPATIQDLRIVIQSFQI